MRSSTTLFACVLMFISSSVTAQTNREVISTPNAHHSITRGNNIAQVDDEKKPFTGKFIEMDGNEKRSEHTYVNGKLHGPFKIWKKNYGEPSFVAEEGNYNNDELHGPYVERWEADRLKKECAYVNGKLDGKWISYSNYNKNVPEVIQFWKLGKRDSTHTWYYENGQPKNIERYKNGKEHGMSAEYDEKGKATLEINYVNGSKHGRATRYYSNGQPSQISNYVNGKLDGDEVVYFENGKVKELRHYKMDSKVGKWIWYNEDGSVQEETSYQQ